MRKSKIKFSKKFQKNFKNQKSKFFFKNQNFQNTRHEY